MRRVIQGSRDALRAALTHAVTEEEIGKNVASLVKVPKPRRKRIKPWSVVEAGRFLADGIVREDHLFAAWMLVLCLGLRRGEVWQDSHGLVFTTKHGTPIEPGNLTRMCALRARRAGLRVIPLRNTRHTCSSLLVALKVHPKVAQRILRHSQIAMTMEVYAEASEDEVRDAISKLSEAMGGAGG